MNLCYLESMKFREIMNYIGLYVVCNIDTKLDNPAVFGRTVYHNTKNKIYEGMTFIFRYQITMRFCGDKSYQNGFDDTLNNSMSYHIPHIISYHTNLNQSQFDLFYNPLILRLIQ